MDRKLEIVEKLIKDGHISLYEGLALLDWGKIEAPILIHQAEGTELKPEFPNEPYIVAYKFDMGGSEMFEVFDQVDSRRQTSRQQALDRFDHMTARTMAEEVYLCEVLRSRKQNPYT